VSDAQGEDGPITCPPGYELGYEFVPDGDGGGYRWFVWVPGMPTAAVVTAFTGAPRYVGGLPPTADSRSTTVTGPEAALAVLREAVAEPNRVLDELDRCVAVQFVQRRQAWEATGAAARRAGARRPQRLPRALRREPPRRPVCWTVAPAGAGNSKGHPLGPRQRPRTGPSARWW
jgi:hypothetical protein